MPTSIELAQPWEGHAPDTLLDVSNDRAIQLVADGWARRAGDPRPEPVGFADTIVLKAAPMSYEDAARISKGGSKADLIAALDSVEAENAGTAG